MATTKKAFLNNSISFFILTSIISCDFSAKSEIPFISDAQFQVDGLFDEENWSNTKQMAITNNNQLYFIQSEKELFIGIKNEEPVARYVDLYLHNQLMGTVNLHASMQLGERLLTPGWNDTIPEWSWGNNKDWSANTVEIINDDEDMSFLESVRPYQGHEFRISKEKMGSGSVLLRLEVKDFIGEASDIAYPPNSSRNATENWLEIKFNN